MGASNDSDNDANNSGGRVCSILCGSGEWKAPQRRPQSQEDGSGLMKQARSRLCDRVWDVGGWFYWIHGTYFNIKIIIK